MTGRHLMAVAGPGAARRSVAGRIVVVEQPVGIDPAEMLADERVRLDVVDAFFLEAPLGRAHLLSLGFAFDRRVAFPSHQPVPEVSQHAASLTR
jgi:hypothetical protein